VVGIFAGLKWRLMTSRIRASKGSTKIGIVVLLVVVVAFLSLIALGLASLRAVPDYNDPIMITIFTVQLVGWVLTPLVAFGVDETVDPARFALLPIRLPALQRGLLVTALIGWFPAGNAIVLIGAAIGIGVPLSVLPIALVCAALQLLLCVILSRAASTAMSALMSSRRGRDLGMAVGLGVFVLYLGFVAVVNNPGDGSALQSGVQRTASVLQWTPPGALAALPGQIAEGAWLRAAVSAVIALLALGLAWWWWSVALSRSLTTVPSTTAGSTPAGSGAEDTAVGVGVIGTMKVVAGRDRRLAWRDPMRRMPWLMLMVLTVVWPFIVVRGPGAVFAVALGAILCGSQAGNQYGVEGSGLWLHLQTITDRVRARGEVLAHAVTALIPGTVIVIVAIAVQAVAFGDYDNIPAALGVCFAALLGGLAAACYLSAAVPYAMPQSRKSLFASSVPGQKGRTTAASLGVLGAGIVIALPAGVAAVLSLLVNPIWGWIGLVVGPAIGVVVLIAAARKTADRYLEQAPEILAVVAAGDRV
jgi:ABC-2 type transport system permease protein